MNAPQNTPQDVGNGGVHASTALFAWVPIVPSDLVPVTGLRLPYTREFALLEAADRRKPAWSIRVWGTQVQHIALDDVVRIGTLPEIEGGIASVPAQVAIRWNTGGVRCVVILDTAGAVRYDTPPADEVQVSLLLPRQSATLVQEGGNGDVLLPQQNQIPITAQFSISARVNATAWALRANGRGVMQGGDGQCVTLATADPVPPGVHRSKSRCTVIFDLPGLGNGVLPIPAGAHTVTVYTGPSSDVGTAPVVVGRFIGFWGGSLGTAVPVGDWTVLGGVQQRGPFVFPGVASHLQVFSTNAVDARVTAVFEVD